MTDTGYWMAENSNFRGLCITDAHFSQRDPFGRLRSTALNMTSVWAQWGATTNEVENKVMVLQSPLIRTIWFIIYALASTDETIDHLETLHQTGSMKDDELFQDLYKRLNVLSKMINNFLSAVQSKHKSRK
jgi:hypothetical protein